MKLLSDTIITAIKSHCEEIKKQFPRIRREHPDIDPAIAFSAAKYWQALERLARE